MRPASAQGVSPCFHLPREPQPKGLAKWKSRFAPLLAKKRPITPAAGPGVQSGKIEKDNISITYALPFSRTIPVRTPQSVSRTEVSRPLCHGRAPLSPGRTACGQSAIAGAASSRAVVALSVIRQAATGRKRARK